MCELVVRIQMQMLFPLVNILFRDKLRVDIN
jgi:hypothetical protein